MFIDGLWEFFIAGGGVKIAVISFCTVGVVFAVTFVASIINVETAAQSKRFFAWFAELGGIAVTACAVLDLLSASSYGVLRSVTLVASLIALIMAEYGLLNVQTAVARFIIKKSRRKGAQASDFSEGAIAQCCEITPVKRIKTAKIKEVLLRRTERSRMESGFGARFGVTYAEDCIRRLRRASLSSADARTVDAIEHNLDVLIKDGDGCNTVAISENCGRIITLLAKYLK